MSKHLMLFLAFGLALSLGLAAIAAWLAPVFHQRLQAYNQRRLAARLAHGNDRYFEELRSLQIAADRPYIAHNFGWHFARIFPFLMLGFASQPLATSLVSFFSE